MEEVLSVDYEQGIEKGIEKKAKEDAVNLLKEGVSVEIIARAIGFPIEDVKKLQKTTLFN
jgi:predicted transposase/invertase (TIGR01784 family)